MTGPENMSPRGQTSEPARASPVARAGRRLVQLVTRWTPFRLIGAALAWLRERSRLARAAAVAVFVTACIGLVGSQTRALDRLEHWLSDWRFTVAGERLDRPHPRVALLLIRDESLLDGPAYMPMDRALLASIIQELDRHAPAAIGLDFIFDKRTDADAALLDAVQAARAPIVLGDLEPRGGVDPLLPRQRETSRAFLEAAARPIGYLNVARDFDGVVRRPATPSETGARASFAARLAEAAGAEPRATTPGDRIDWLTKPARGDAPVSIFYADEPILRDALAAEQAFKGRVVIIGSGLSFSSDRMATPIDRAVGRQAWGAEVVAQMVAQQLDGRRLVDIGGLGALILAALAAFAGALGALMFGRTIFDAIAATTLFGLFDVALFALFGLVSPLGVTLLAWGAGAVLATALDDRAGDAPRERSWE